MARQGKLVATFRQAAFGRRSEKIDPDRFELALEDLETATAVIHAEDRAAKRPARPRAANRGALPKHLPRTEKVIEPDSLTCACGRCLRGLNMDFECAKYVCSPPPREAGSQTAIWQGLRDGTFDIFSSDHSGVSTCSDLLVLGDQQTADQLTTVRFSGDSSRFTTGAPR